MWNGITILLVFLLLLTSCASHTDVHPDPTNIQSVIQPGDNVRIVTVDDQEVDFKVIEVTEDYIIGENIKVPLKDITGMKEETASAEKNALLITIFTLGVAAAVLVGGASIPYGASPASEALSDTLLAGSALAAGSMLSTNLGSVSHPGDWYAFKHDSTDERFCIQDCMSKVVCKDESPLDTRMQQYWVPESNVVMESCLPKLECKFNCKQKEHPKGSIATHVQGGYYTDGSYYNGYYFKNTHPTKDKYKKANWQKDRDECMELASESVELNWWNTTARNVPDIKAFNEQKTHYLECLKERGYTL